ncbi:type I-C CRISPR-associated protein Cas8c/Csd1 [Clostridiaceae bacterium NSJ-31]|uniref:Type I-C CRISPR-associated protein Cas8c/Csd1 n=1 Tax=Ligaoa zhengdingensis TaxID=2763658 RepID=A0A926E0D3_9FIRM|nr:type I-C CRISPR-associated protein Cas8c/Csd1 [Ligaoa zhengdingensis]MBC8546510.1 type I-C CRISPR-associated protein Cas8c/Csd1 [Ligaoa zhengdingensis]
MILNALVRYYEDLAQQGTLSPQGWVRTKVSFALNLSPSGELLGLIPLMQEVQRGKKTVEIPQEFNLPQPVKRTVGIASNFLWDNATYLLGLDSKGRPQRTLDCFSNCRELHIRLLDPVDSPAARAVKAFFFNWQPECIAGHPALAPYLEELSKGGNLIFLVDGMEFAHDDPDIRRAWDRTLTSDGDAPVLRCLVTGEQAPIARLHPSIKGVKGGQPTGTSLVSFNAPSFESYGHEQGLNAPVGEYAAFAYTAALNYLVADSAHCKQIGEMTVVYWAQGADPSYQDAFSGAFDPSSSAVDDALLDGLFTKIAGGRAPNLEALERLDMSTPFYILGLAPNASRLSVRFFLRGEFGGFLRNLKAHYDRLDIARAPYERAYLSAFALLREVVNPNAREKNPPGPMSSSLLRAILTDTYYPQSLVNGVMLRIRAEQDNDEKHIRKISRGRAAILKAWLLKNKPNLSAKEALTVSLNESCNSLPYVLGRIFSVLESVQKKANPKLNATIKDRYFNSASTTPATVFPVLLRLSNAHIHKLRGKKADEYENRLGSLMNRIEMNEHPYPARLTLEEQGIFILGYYHQTQVLKNETEDVENG